MNLSDFEYDLPQEYIAQHPAEPRDSSRLMVLDKLTGDITHHIFHDLADMLVPGDLLVLNNTRVIPARLRAAKSATGGAVEILLLRQIDTTLWRALIGGRNVQIGSTLTIADSGISVEIMESHDGAERTIRFSEPINPHLVALGEAPLPPYITTPLADPERYQTVYAQTDGSAAAPTAGLHFTPELLMLLRAKGVGFTYCTLHIGLGTFKPVNVERIEDYQIHAEFASLKAEDARLINETKLAGGRVIAVGTTVARTLETAGILSAGGNPSEPQHDLNICAWRPVIAFEGDTRLFIYPGYRWRVVDAMVTNFHLPKSSLLMMISSLVGREKLMHAYEVAKQKGYRFFSFGDAMFIR